MSGGRVIRTPEEQSKYQRLGRVGLVKVGYKDEAGKPHSSDFFIPDGEYAEQFDKAFGKEPKKLKIVFYTDDQEEVCNERIECWGTKQSGDEGKLLAFGDGETFFAFDPKTEDYTKRLNKEQAREIKGRWRLLLTMKFLLPQIPIVGYWQLTTSGKESSIPGIIAMFDWAMKTGGSVSMYPWDLTVKFCTSKKPGSKSRYPVIQILPNLSYQQVEALRDARKELDAMPGLITAERVEKVMQEKMQLEAPK